MPGDAVSRGVVLRAAPRLASLDPRASVEGAMNAPRALVLSLVLMSAVALTARPSLAGEEALAGLSFLDPVPAAVTGSSPLDALDLSVVRDGAESTLRVPLAGREDNRPQR